jgi:hypothetical protein
LGPGSRISSFAWRLPGIAIGPLFAFLKAGAVIESCFLVDSGEALHIKDLVKLYGREAIIQERLKRLERWGKSPEREIASSVRGESV